MDNPSAFLPSGSSLETDNSFIPYNNVPMGVAHSRDRLFISVPRRAIGIPSTLNYINLKDSAPGSSPRLRPYPNVAFNSLEHKSSSKYPPIVSVYRLRVDACQRLWFVDTGLLEFPGLKIIRSCIMRKYI